VLEVLGRRGPRDLGVEGVQSQTTCAASCVAATRDPDGRLREQDRPAPAQTWTGVDAIRNDSRSLRRDERSLARSGRATASVCLPPNDPVHIDVLTERSRPTNDEILRSLS